MSPLTRRQFIGGATGLIVAANGLALPAAGVTINPRSSWATNRPPKGPLDPEQVEFLLVHHSASRNGHTGADAPAILRSFYDFHTSPEKGWNDIAYNFLIDADGGIWEGRAGSLDGPVAGDATGGNQGFSQLVCVIGDYNSAQPSQASMTSLVLLLAWLADRYGISTAPGAQVTFTSRGSNKWPAGAEVTTSTINGHRSMSKTTCPGDNLHTYVAGSLTADVESARGGTPPVSSSSTTSSTTTSTTSTTSTSTTTSSTTTTTTPTTTTAISTTSTSPTPTTAAPPTTAATPTSPPTPVVAMATEDAATLPAGPLLAAGAMVVTGAALLAWRHRRMGG